MKEELKEFIIDWFRNAEWFNYVRVFSIICLIIASNIAIFSTGIADTSVKVAFLYMSIGAVSLAISVME